MARGAKAPAEAVDAPLIDLRQDIASRRRTRRCGDVRVFPGRRQGARMTDWRRGGEYAYRNDHRWATAFLVRLEAWRWGE